MTGGTTPIVDPDALGELGYGLVLYANAALQGALAGMQKALTVLRDTHALTADSGLVAPFAQRQRLVVGKPLVDALEARYTARARAGPSQGSRVTCPACAAAAPPVAPAAARPRRS